MLLAGLGIYSIVAFSVASRVQEMAIRIALGSQRVDILRLVLISGAKLAAVGAVIGLAGAAAASSLVRSFLFQVSPFDPGGAGAGSHCRVCPGANGVRDTSAPSSGGGPDPGAAGRVDVPSAHGKF